MACFSAIRCSCSPAKPTGPSSSRTPPTMPTSSSRWKSTRSSNSSAADLPNRRKTGQAALARASPARSRRGAGLFSKLCGDAHRLISSIARIASEGIHFSLAGVSLFFESVRDPEPPFTGGKCGLEWKREGKNPHFVHQTTGIRPCNTPREPCEPAISRNISLRGSAGVLGAGGTDASVGPAVQSPPRSERSPPGKPRG